MLVLVPTREDVLAIRSIDEAFDLSTRRVRSREVKLIRVALAEGLLESSLHEIDAARDELIEEAAIDRVIAYGKPVSKDVDATGLRQPGVNFEGEIRGRRRIRVKVSWDDGYYIATVHTI